MSAENQPKKPPGRPKKLAESDRRISIGVKVKPAAVEKLDRLARAQRRTRSALAAILLEDALEELRDSED